MREREIERIATSTYPQPRGWTTPSSSWPPSGWWRWPPEMVPLSGRVLKRLQMGFSSIQSVAEAERKFPVYFWGFLYIYQGTLNGATWTPQAIRARPGGGRALLTCGPQVAPLWWFFAPIFLICSIQNCHKVSGDFENFHFPHKKQNEGNSTENSANLG